MIGERETYHGIALARLIQDSNRTFSIATWPSIARSAYVVDGTTALYIKYSTKRLAPWSFEFSSVHAAELDQLSSEFENLWIVLVCGPVGVAAESWKKAGSVIAPRSDDSFSLTVRWRPNHRFRLSGARNNPLVVSDSSYPSSLF